MIVALEHELAPSFAIVIPLPSIPLVDVYSSRAQGLGSRARACFREGACVAPGDLFSSSEGMLSIRPHMGGHARRHLRHRGRSDKLRYGCVFCCINITIVFKSALSYEIAVAVHDLLHCRGT